MPASAAQLPFKEAIDFFKNKIQLPSAGWTDIWHEQHSLAFVVAGAQTDALVSDFYNAILKAKEQGTGYGEFKKDFEQIVANYKWAYNGTAGWRSKIIYDTNMTQAYNAGRYQQMMDLRELRPFWQYRHTSQEHPRLQHKAWDGIILPAGDTWFNTHMPQNGWRCKCRVDSLSHTEAAQAWQAAGKSGPDTAPAIEWEDKVVGKNSNNPRTVSVPKGIDPGFAYNPGKAYLEPHTVPPMTGYEAVLKERNTPWPAGFTPPAVRPATVLPASVLLPKGTPPEVAVTQFLDVFGATMDRAVAFEDAAQTSVIISKALFQNGRGQFKWQTRPDKAARLEDINLMAMTLADPDEIWWYWQKDDKETGKWRLKRRYLKSFEVGDSKEYAMSIFEWGDGGWIGATTFSMSQKTETKRAQYFDDQRLGKLVYKK